MKVYLDSSFIVDFLLGKPETRNIIQDLGSEFYTSKLTRVETIRTMKKHYPEWLNDLFLFLSSISLLEIDDDVLRTAENFGEAISLKAADAIHLATALLLLEDQSVLVTLDKQMAMNAKMLGLEVII